MNDDDEKFSGAMWFVVVGGLTIASWAVMWALIVVAMRLVRWLGSLL